MNQPILRSRLAAPTDPNETLGALLGPKFADYRRAFARAEAGERPDIPLHLDVDVTTACNFGCPMCPSGNSGHNFPGLTRGRFLPRDMYDRALEEAAGFGLPSLRLGITGEPLLVPDLPDWVRAARAAGVLDVSLVTNGRLLTPEMSRRLVEAGLTRLMISVDAGSAATYARVRPGGDWEILLRHIAEFRRIRQELASVTPLLRVSFVEMSTNRDDREAFERIFAPLADYLSFQRYQNILGALDTDFRPGTETAGDGRPAGFCAEPFTRLALHAQGGLSPCCSDFGRRAPVGRFKPGAGSLLAAWRSAAALALTRPGARTESPCRECLAAAG